MSATPVPIPTRILVLGMARPDGTIAADELSQVAAACGQKPEQVRSCLRRLVAEGLFERAGSGRRAIYEPTAAGRAALSADRARTRLAYAQDAAGKAWDGVWRLVAFAVPERRRAARTELRERLIAFGGAAIQGGLYVSPRPWHDDVRAAATELGLGGDVSYAEATSLELGEGVRDPRALARALWPVDDLADAYSSFVERYAELPDSLAAMHARHEHVRDAQLLPAALSIAVNFQSAFARDPLLPPELLPRPWPGRAAREILVKCHRMATVMREESGSRPLFRGFEEAIEALS